MDINIYGVNGEGGMGGTDPITDPIHDETCDFESLEYLGNGSGNELYDNRFKVCAPEGFTVVNIQNPAFANETGIYLAAPSAIVSCSLSEDKYVIQGAGIVLYCSAFANEITTVNISTPDEEYTVQVYQRMEEPTPTMQPVVALAGDFNEWDTSANVLVPDTDNLTASVTVHLSVSNYLFKIVVDGRWLSLNGDGDGMYGFHRDWTSVSHVNMENGMNFNLNTDVEGDYTFTWTYADSTITITFPEYTPVVGDNAYYLIGNTEQLGAWNPNSALLMENNTITVNLPAGSYAIKVLDESKSWDSAMGYLYVNKNCSSSGIAMDEDKNAVFVLEESGSVTVSANEREICLTGSFKVPETGQYTNYAALVNHDSTFNFYYAGKAGSGYSQYKAQVRLREGDTLRVINRADGNSVMQAQLDNYGLVNNFRSDYYNSYHVCVVEGCYSVYYSYNNLYIEWGGECPTGAAYTGEILPTGWVQLRIKDGQYGNGHVSIDGEGADSYEGKSGIYVLGMELNFEAQPTSSYQFLQWSDNNYANPRPFVVTGDTIIYADFGSLDHYPTGILLNHKKFIRSTYNDGTQLIVRANIQDGDTVELYFLNDNIYWMAELEPYGKYESFSGGAEQGHLICHETGCYDIYFKMVDGITQTIYIGEGTQCFDGEDWTDPNNTSEKVYSVVGTENLFGKAWDLTDSITVMKPAGDDRYEYNLDSVILVPGGDYQYKVIANHAWNIEEYPSVQEDDNYTITVEDPGVYMVLFSFQPGVGCSATTNYLHAIQETQPQPTGKAWYITPSSPYESDNIRRVMQEASAGDTIILADGTYDESNGNYLAFDKSLLLMAEAGASPIIRPQVPFTISNGAHAEMIGIKIDATNLTAAAEWYEHLIYASDDNADNSLLMSGCELYNFTLNKSALYCSSANSLSSCAIINCYIHDMTKSVMYFEGESMQQLTVANSTVANVTTDMTGYYAAVIDARGANTAVVVDRCTFYNCQVMNSDYAVIKAQDAGSPVITNCIFAMPESYETGRAVYTNSGTVSFCLMHNYTKDSGLGIHLGPSITSCVNDDPLFVDAASGDFMLGAGSPAIHFANDGGSLGDPRWGVESVSETLSSTDFVEPYVFTGASARLSGKVDLNEDSLLVWNNNTDETLNGVATWRIHITRPCYVAAVLNMSSTSTSGHRYSVEVLDATNTVLGEPLTEAADSWAATDVALDGTILIPEEGDYTIRLSNATAWSGAILSSVTLAYASTYNNDSTDFSSPYFFAAADAMIDDNITLLESSLKYVSRQTCGIADWNILVTKPCNVKVTINMDETSSSGHSFEVAILDSEHTQLGNTVAEEVSSWEHTDIELPGSLHIPSAGNYTIRLLNNTQWSEAIVRGITLEALEEQTQPEQPQPCTTPMASGTCNVGQTVSVVFKATTDGSSPYADDSQIKSNLVESYTGIESFTGERLFTGKSGIKLGSTSASGSITMELSTPIMASMIQVEASQYGSDNATLSITVNGSTTFGEQLTVVSGVLTFSNPETLITNLTITTTNKRAYIRSITIDSNSASDGNLTWELSCDSVLTISGTGAMPDYANSNDVPWFNYQTSIREVYVEEGVTSLGKYAFSNCSKLWNVDLPSTLTSIGESCFSNCAYIDTITCRATTPPTAYSSTFAEDNYMLTVYVPKDKTDAYQAAEGWNSFTDFREIGGTEPCEPIASGTCGVDGDNLTWVFDCDSTLTISGKGRMAFYGEGAPYTPWKGYMNDIKKLVVEDSVTYISDYTCLRAEKLKEVIIGEGVTRIGHGAFCTCNNLERVLLPSTVDTIEEQTFQSCVKLKYIELPAPMKYIGGWAFYYCYLDSIKCYATTPPVLADNAFEGVSTSTPVFVPDISLSTYRKADVWSSFSNFRALPACVTDSGYCGANDNNLTWKMYCDSVLAIMGTGAMSEYSGSSSVPWHEHAANIREAVVGEGVTSLSTSAFEGYSKLTTVTLPEGLTSIGMYAFSNCTSLKGIDLPATTTSIGSYCFGECPNMDSITCRATIPPAANGSTFAGVDVTIPLYVPARSISKYRAADGWSSFSDIRAVPVCVRDSGTCGVDGDNLTWTLTCDGLLTISGTGRMAFYGEGAPNTPWKEYMNDIKKLVVEDGVTYISDYTCLRAGKLKEVIIGEGVTRIGHGAFCTCNNLERVVLPSTVDTIEEQTFQSCVKLKYIELPAPMKYIGGWAFYYCYFDSIKCYATTPPVLADNAFEGVSTSIPVFVPYRSAVAYRSDAGWSRFSNINEMPECLIASGECGAQGDNVTWKLSCDSVLTISGTGAMANYTTNSNGQAPWAAYGLQIRDIVIEEGVTTISAYGFYNAGSYTDGAYNNVRNVSIPSTVSKLENNYFYQCPIEYVSINSDSIVGKGSFSSGSSLHRIFGAQVREYYIGNNVKSIANSAFYNQGADSLAYITLPEGLESIGTWAFGYIEHLTFITIPDSVQTIGSDAFAGCENLESVVLGESLTRIDGQAFWMCDNLTQVTCYAMNPPTLNSTSFDHYDTLIVRCEAKSLYQEADYWKNFTLIMCPDDTTGSYVEPDAPEQITFALDSSWKFIMLPTIFGMIQDDIIVDGGEIEWGTYNSEQRAAGLSGWQGFVPSSGFSASRSYIIRARNGSAVLTINVPEQAREKAGAAIPFAYNESAHQQNANWNFLGNPYPFSYDIMAALLAQGITSPIAVWNGIGYITYTPGIDVKILDPFEAFFIQMPQNGVQAIQYTPEYIVADNGSMNTGDGIIDSYGALPGRFSVGEGMQVQFARGNLQYNAAKDMWQFAENQYDIIGEDNANISDSYDGWIDLFGWGTGNNPTLSTQNYEDYNTFVDWGTNTISNGGNEANVWRTLTKDEWVYLFYNRANASTLFGTGHVNNVNGVIILPDDWVTPSSITFEASTTRGLSWDGEQYTNANSDNYSHNIFTIDEWQILESAGALFIPADGYRTGTEVNVVGEHINTWSSTPNNDNSAYYLNVCSSFLNPQDTNTHWDGYRDGGLSVRLVK